jgi:hypothetical protein
LQIIERDEWAAVGSRTDVNDPGWGTGLESVEEQIGEEKIGEMVDGELGLEAIPGDGALPRDDSCVVN